MDVLPNNTLVFETKSKIARQNKSTLTQKYKNLEKVSPEQMGRVITEARGKGASSWLSILPLEKFVFDLNKGELRHAIRFRFAKGLCGLPSQGVSSTMFIMH